MTSHILRQGLPRRPVVLACIVTVVAIVGIVVGLLRSQPAFVVLGIAFLLASAALIGAALTAWVRGQVRVELDDQGYAIHGPQGVQRGSWANVKRVTMSEDGTRITFFHDGDRRSVLVGRGVGALGADIAAYLDRHRGYGQIVS